MERYAHNMEFRYEIMRPDQLLAMQQHLNAAYLPVGPLEWHGPAMPFGTDPLYARAVTERVAAKIGGVVLPTLFLGTETYRDEQMMANLGFEDYWFVENYFTEFTGGGVALDDVFFPELLKTYQAATAGDQPYFHFSVTYQGHGPYNNDLCWWGEKGDFVVDDGTYTEEQQYILDNYFGSIADTNAHIKEFTDYLREDEEPVVLVLFGDHNPWMGDGNSVYTAMGIDFDLSSQQGFYNYYSTPYLIWANPAAQEVLGKDFRGEGPDMSPCFLMSKVFELCGWEGPAYMQAIAETVETLPVVHKSGRCVEEGLLTDQPQNAELLRQFRALEYYYRKNFIYE